MLLSVLADGDMTVTKTIVLPFGVFNGGNRPKQKTKKKKNP